MSLSPARMKGRAFTRSAEVTDADSNVSRQWLAMASQWSVIRRGLAYAFIVGSILILIIGKLNPGG